MSNGYERKPLPLRILFVEDDPDDVALACAALEKEEFLFECMVATTQSEFLQLVQALPDVIVSDFNLPDFTGADALAITNRLASDAIFILSSGDLPIESAVNLIKAGARDFVNKSDIAKLGAVLRRELRDEALRYEKRAAIAELEWQGLLFQTMQQVANIGAWEYELKTDALYFSEQTFLIHETDPASYSPQVDSAIEFYVGNARKRIREEFEALLSTGRPFDVQLDFKTAKGNLRFVRSRGQAKMENGKIVAVFGTIQDITDQHRMEEQLFQNQKMEAVGELAGGLAHDFNNILTVVQGNLEMALSRIAEEDDVREMLETAYKASERGADLTEAMLSYSRRQNLSPERVDLNNLVTNLVKITRGAVRSNIRIVTRLDARLPMIVIDPAQFENVLMNIIFNARDAISLKGMITIATTLLGEDENHPTLRQLTDSHFVKISIKDNGRGMDAETRERALEPFFTTKPTGKGTGLGLSLVYGFISQSGGHVDLESTPGLGTTVNIYLPTGIEKKPPSAKVTRHDSPGISPESTLPTILLVEDEIDILKIFETALLGGGFNVISTSEGQRASELITEQGKIDALVTDIVLADDLDGFDIAEKFAVYNPGAAIFLVTGYSDEFSNGNSNHSFEFKLLKKPITPARLLKIIKDQLDQRR